MKKQIQDSWSKIKPSPATHQRILGNILEYENAKGKTTMAFNTVWKVLAPVAACVIAAALIAVPRLLTNDDIYVPPAQITEDGRIVENGQSPNQEPEDATSQQDISQPGLAQPSHPQMTYQLVINQATIEVEVIQGPHTFGTHFQPRLIDEETGVVLPGLNFTPYAFAEYFGTYFQPRLIDEETGEEIETSATSSRTVPWLTFMYILTDEEIGVVLPGLNFTPYAFAEYSNDGSLLHVIASELTSPLGLPPLVMHLSPTDSRIMFTFEDAPQQSYVYETSVIAAELRPATGELTSFVADFELGGIFYTIHLIDYMDSPQGPARLTQVVNDLIINGPADLSVLADPVIPELRGDILTYEDALADPDFGAFVPQTVPEDMIFSDAWRVVSQHSNYLTLSWYEMWASSISWSINVATPYHHHQMLVSADDRHKFDVNLYTIPWMDSVPQEYINYLLSPIFRAEDMSKEIIEARALQGGRGTGYSINFGVMFDGEDGEDSVVVQISSFGLSPEYIWNMLKNLL